VKKIVKSLENDDDKVLGTLLRYVWCVIYCNEKLTMCLTFPVDIISGIGYQTTIQGAYDDPNGSHISIEVTSSLFEGKRRQQLVYKA